MKTFEEYIKENPVMTIGESYNDIFQSTCKAFTNYVDEIVVPEKVESNNIGSKELKIDQFNRPLKEFINDLNSVIESAALNNYNYKFSNAEIVGALEFLKYDVITED